MFRRVIIALACILLLLPGLLFFSGCSAPKPDNASWTRAAIIDQLDPTHPNPDFIAQATVLLEKKGFKVDHFSGESVTLELYRQLPESGYSLIIFRAHSGLLGNGSKADQQTCLFTNQPYRQMSEIADQLFNRVVKASVNTDPPLFGVGADFINHSLHGRFNKTVVIVMGCSSFEKDDLAQAFLDKGAAAYCGWDSEVKLDYDEGVTLTLLERFYELKSIDAAVRAAMSTNGPDPQTGAVLKCLSAAPICSK
jgi:hypothetical protein